MSASPCFEGRLFGLFSFDVGYEIDLVQVRAIEATEPRMQAPKRLQPRSFDYVSSPAYFPLGSRTLELQGASYVAQVTAIVHEFGAATLLFEMRIERSLEELAGLTAHLTRERPLERDAWELIRGLVERLMPMIVKPGLADLIEDYYVLQADQLQPEVPVARLLADYAGTLASILRCEEAPLSLGEIEDCLRTNVSYDPADLTITDWNVALLLDDDYLDTLAVLEYLNVQLLELRYHDAQLDRRVNESYEFEVRPRGLRALWLRPYAQTIDSLAAVRLETSAIYERIHNAWKLSGDLYLAKIYQRTADRLALPAWERSVERKLDVLEQRYDAIVNRVTTLRSEVLEVTIVLLILLEIVLFLLGLG